MMDTGKTKFTPGPWGVSGDGVSVYYLNPWIEAGKDIEDPRHDSIIATCTGFGPMSGIEEFEAQANARLISAAPELLGACEFALKQLGDMTTEEFARGADREIRETLRRDYAETGRENRRLRDIVENLLQACELAEATIERLNRHNSADGTLQVLRAAIAKAKGEE